MDRRISANVFLSIIFLVVVLIVILSVFVIDRRTKNHFLKEQSLVQDLEKRYLEQKAEQEELQEKVEELGLSNNM